MKLAFAAFLFSATSALANIDVRFVEGAPVDQFFFSAASGCPLGAAELTVDLTGSAGGLIFDPTGAGAGVSVYQPLVLVEGASQVLAMPDVRDGDKIMVLKLAELNRLLSFTTDLDDTMGASETMVSGAEIAGAVVSVTLAGDTYSGVFDDSATARIAIPACLS
ncbi:MAG: aggregation factor core [Arenibacterium sp.]